MIVAKLTFIRTFIVLAASNRMLYFMLVFSAVLPAVTARGCRKVARHVHDSNGIVDARSLSPLAPDLVAALSEEGLQSLASSSSPSNQSYTMRSNIFVLDRIVSRFGTEKGVFKRLLFV